MHPAFTEGLRLSSGYTMSGCSSGVAESFRLSFRFGFRLGTTEGTEGVGRKEPVMTQGVKPPNQAETEEDLHLGPFRLEGTKRLWRGEQLIDVRPRPLAVLRYLAERPGRLVTGEELLKQLWPGIYVTKTVLRVCVREIRQALNEGPSTVQCIETVGRQGYRFIVPDAITPLVAS